MIIKNWNNGCAASLTALGQPSGVMSTMEQKVYRGQKEFLYKYKLILL